MLCYSVVSRKFAQCWKLGRSFTLSWVLTWSYLTIALNFTWKNATGMMIGHAICHLNRSNIRWKRGYVQCIWFASLTKTSNHKTCFIARLKRNSYYVTSESPISSPKSLAGNPLLSTKGPFNICLRKWKKFQDNILDG